PCERSEASPGSHAGRRPGVGIAGRRLPVPPVIDLARLPAGDRETEGGRLAAAEARGPFDLARGPLLRAAPRRPRAPRGGLLRAALLRLGSERQVALVTMHHIVSDGWSMAVLVGELWELYAAFLAGAPSPLPELPMQYAEFAAWQRRHLSGELLAAELGWWR